MKLYETIDIYKCKMCGYRTENISDIKKHTLNHLKLNEEEFNEYIKLLKETKSCSMKVYYEKNNKNEEEFDKKIENLLSFERKHNLTGEIRRILI